MVGLEEFYDTQDINLSKLELDDVAKMFDMIAIYMFDNRLSSDIGLYRNNSGYINKGSLISRISSNLFEEDYSIIHESAINAVEVSKVLKYFVGRISVGVISIDDYIDYRDDVMRYCKSPIQAFTSFSRYFNSILPKKLKEIINQKSKKIGGLHE